MWQKPQTVPGSCCCETFLSARAFKVSQLTPPCTENLTLFHSRRQTQDLQSKSQPAPATLSPHHNPDEHSPSARAQLVGFSPWQSRCPVHGSPCPNCPFLLSQSSAKATHLARPSLCLCALTLLGPGGCNFIPYMC